MTIKSANDLASMRAVGKLVGQALREMRAAVHPGMTTEQLGAWKPPAAGRGRRPKA